MRSSGSFGDLRRMVGCLEEELIRSTAREEDWKQKYEDYVARVPWRKLQTCFHGFVVAEQTCKQALQLLTEQKQMYAEELQTSLGLQARLQELEKQLKQQRELEVEMKSQIQTLREELDRLSGVVEQKNRMESSLQVALSQKEQSVETCFKVIDDLAMKKQENEMLRERLFAVENKLSQSELAKREDTKRLETELFNMEQKLNHTLAQLTTCKNLLNETTTENIELNRYIETYGDVDKALKRRITRFEKMLARERNQSMQLEEENGKLRTHARDYRDLMEFYEANRDRRCVRCRIVYTQRYNYNASCKFHQGQYEFEFAKARYRWSCCGAPERNAETCSIEMQHSEH